MGVQMGPHKRRKALSFAVIFLVRTVSNRDVPASS